MIASEGKDPIMHGDKPFTIDDLETACNDLSMLEFFPHQARASVMTLLRKICPHKRALKWLVAELVNKGKRLRITMTEELHGSKERVVD